MFRYTSVSASGWRVVKPEKGQTKGYILAPTPCVCHRPGVHRCHPVGQADGGVRQKGVVRDQRLPDVVLPLLRRRVRPRHQGRDGGHFPDGGSFANRARPCSSSREGTCEKGGQALAPQERSFRHCRRGRGGRCALPHPVRHPGRKNAPVLQSAGDLRRADARNAVCRGGRRHQKARANKQALLEAWKRWGSKRWRSVLAKTAGFCFGVELCQN